MTKEIEWRKVRSNDNKLLRDIGTICDCKNIMNFTYDDGVFPKAIWFRTDKATFEHILFRFGLQNFKL